MRVLVAMSGGVDSSVAAALLADAGHEVVGATLKLWGGDGDSGCCAVSDVDDARRVAQQLGIDHHVFDFGDVFDAAVVTPYVDAHRDGATPNPCIECNRHVKFELLLGRALRLGFDALATGHHARVADDTGGRRALRRGADRSKDQSYVLSMLTQRHLRTLVLPVGDLTKAEVRSLATELGLRTAAKPDSQDVCFVGRPGARAGFLAGRIALHEGEVVSARSGAVLGRVPAVELVTVGQRRGLGVGVDRRRHYAVDVDVAARRVLVAEPGEADTEEVALDPATQTWVDEPPATGAAVLVQTSAHGATDRARLGEDRLLFAAPRRRVAPGQTVALYDPADPDRVLGSAVAVR